MICVVHVHLLNMIAICNFPLSSGFNISTNDVLEGLSECFEISVPNAFSSLSSVLISLDISSSSTRTRR